MNNKLNNMINEFLKNVEAKDQEELNEKLKEFVKQYNNGELKYENTPLDDAYEILEKAQNAKTAEESIKYAKKAYDMCPDCFEAILLQAQLEENPLKRSELLDQGLEREKNKLVSKNYFRKDYIGKFYTIFQTRAYITGLYAKADYFLLDGKIKQARDVCKEILKLNESDNMGARYFLMAIYAYLEDEKELLKLYDKYTEANLSTLFPLLILYYKLGDDKKAQEYIKEINEANPNFIKFFKGKMKIEKDISGVYYSIGEPSEIIMYLRKYDFLLLTVPTIDYYILKNYKK